jgi:hypothetical protein
MYDAVNQYLMAKCPPAVPNVSTREVGTPFPSNRPHTLAHDFPHIILPPQPELDTLTFEINNVIDGILSEEDIGSEPVHSITTLTLFTIP